MAFTLNARNSTTSDGSTTTIAVALTGVAAGDLIAMFVKWEGADTTVTAAGGGDNLTAATKTNHTGGEPHGQWFYFLSSVATGSVTYTATLSAARSWKKAYCFAITPDSGDTVSFDAEGVASGTNTNPTSGSFSPSGTDIIVFGGHCEYGGQSESAWQVNGSATGVVVEAQSTGSAWYKLLVTGFTGTVDVTISATARWVCNGISFNAVAGAAGATGKSNPLAGPLGGPLAGILG